MAPPAVPKRATLFSPSYRSRRVLHIRFSCQVPCSFPLGFSSGSSPALQLFCGFASLWYCFLSVKSHNNGQQLWLGVLFHLHWPPLAVFGVFFHFSFLNSLPLLHEYRQRWNFLFFGPRLTAFIENSLAKSGIFSGISLAHLSTALKNRPDEKF